jgi:hypothetical protein
MPFGFLPERAFGFAGINSEIAAPPMNLLGAELVRDLVSFIKQGEPNETCRVLVFKSADAAYFSFLRCRHPHERVPGGGGEAQR